MSQALESKIAGAAPVPFTVVYHKGRVYEVPFADVEVLRKEHIDAICERAHALGLRLSPTGMWGCMYCDHSPVNLAILASTMKAGEMHIESDADHSGRCRFYCDDTKLASVLTHEPSGNQYLAQPAPCAYQMAWVQTLAEKSALDKYEVKRDFDYPTIAQLENSSVTRKKFLFRGDESKRTGIVRRLYDAVLARR